MTSIKVFTVSFWFSDDLKKNSEQLIIIIIYLLERGIKVTGSWNIAQSHWNLHNFKLKISKGSWNLDTLTLQPFKLAKNNFNYLQNRSWTWKSASKHPTQDES